VGSSEVWHFINLRGVHDLEWRDRNAERAAPAVVSDLSLVLPAKRPVRRVWTASPDLNGGVPVRLAHTLHEHRLSVTLPRLEYWGMVVVEYADE
jgi:dextranase